MAWKMTYGLTLNITFNVWFVYVMLQYMVCVCACTWALTLVCVHTVHVCVPAECKHIQRLPVWWAHWGTIYREREGSRKTVIEERERETQNDANSERWNETCRKEWGVQQQEKAGRSEDVWEVQENNTLNKSQRPDSDRYDRDATWYAVLKESGDHCGPLAGKSESRNTAEKEKWDSYWKTETVQVETKQVLSGCSEMIQASKGHGKLRQPNLEKIQVGQTWGDFIFMRKGFDLLVHWFDSFFYRGKWPETMDMLCSYWGCF